MVQTNMYKNVLMYQPRYMYNITRVPYNFDVYVSLRNVTSLSALID